MDTITAHDTSEPDTNYVANTPQRAAAAAWVARNLATAPPLTEERRARLAAILRPAPLTLAPAA